MFLHLRFLWSESESCNVFINRFPSLSQNRIQLFYKKGRSFSGINKFSHLMGLDIIHLFRKKKFLRKMAGLSRLLLLVLVYPRHQSSLNESERVSSDKLLVLSGLVRCLFRVSPLHFYIVIALNVIATSSNVLTCAFYSDHI